MADCMEKDWSFTGSDGVHTLYATIWEPSEGEPRAVIQICHGMMEHIRRYDRFARALCDRGFVVCGDDHLGHGRTAEQPEDLGYFGETDGWKHNLIFKMCRRPLTPRFISVRMWSRPSSSCDSPPIDPAGDT